MGLSPSLGSGFIKHPLLNIYQSIDFIDLPPWHFHVGRAENRRNRLSTGYQQIINRGGRILL